MAGEIESNIPNLLGPSLMVVVFFHSLTGKLQLKVFRFLSPPISTTTSMFWYEANWCFYSFEKS